MGSTCSALNTIYLPFGLYICKQYQWLLQAIYGPKRHHPITLSEICKEDKLAVSTKPLVASVLTTPIHNNSGEPINIAFAAGHLVLVNLIFGLPYLQYTGSIVDHWCTSVHWQDAKGRIGSMPHVLTNLLVIVSSSFDNIG